MSKHLSDIELFELANNLIENKQQKEKLILHVNNCLECKTQLEQEQQLDELLTNKLIVDQQVDVSEKVSQHFNIKEFASAPDTKWVLYTILGLVTVLLGMELIDGDIILSNTPFNSNTINYMRIILSSITAVLFIDVVFKFVKYRKRLI